MVIKPPKEFNAKDELAKGAWHVWDFGPSLLTESGEAINDFIVRCSGIANALYESSVAMKQNETNASMAASDHV